MFIYGLEIGTSQRGPGGEPQAESKVIYGDE